MEDVNGVPQNSPRIRGCQPKRTFPNFSYADQRQGFLSMPLRAEGETVLIGDVNTVKGWSQPDWLPAIAHGWACRLFKG